MFSNVFFQILMQISYSYVFVSAYTHQISTLHNHQIADIQCKLLSKILSQTWHKQEMFK